MKNKLLLMISSFFCITCLMSVMLGVSEVKAADTYVYGDLYYQIVDGEAIFIEPCDEDIEYVVIPETVAGYPVISIGEAAFSDCVNLREVVLPESILSIGDYAFSDCERLLSVNIPKNVTYIGYCAFLNCSYLLDVELPKTVIKIGTCAFAGCENFSQITIPGTVKVMGGYIFQNCTNLKDAVIEEGVTEIPIGMFSFTGLETITIPDTVVSIGEEAFESSNLKSVAIPNGVTTIGASAFALTKLKEIVIPNNVVSLGKNVFSSSTLESIVFSSNLTSISSGAFSGCNELVSIVIPNNIKIIDEYAFGACKSLEEVIIPDSVVAIGNEAFAYCWELSNITIPNSVKSIGEDAFYEVDVIHNLGTSIGSPWGADEVHNVAYEECIPCCKHTKVNSKVTAATPTKNGSIVKTCKNCGEKISKKTIYKIGEAKLSTSVFVYNGNIRKLTVTVKDSQGKVLKQGRDYKLTYANGRKAVGGYSVKITFKGNYSGTKTLYFKIIPKATDITSLTAGGRQLTVKWNKVPNQITGYQIKYSTSSEFKDSQTKTINIEKTGTITKTFKNLTAGKKYYVKVRSYKTVNGTKYYSNWSKVKNVMIKPVGTSINKVTAGSEKITLKWNKVAAQITGYQIQYSTQSSFKTSDYIKVPNMKTTTKSISNLKSGKKYYVRIRTYRIVDGKTIYSNWSAVKNTKVK